jgi:hypothetical protein
MTSGARSTVVKRRLQPYRDMTLMLGNSSTDGNAPSSCTGMKGKNCVQNALPNTKHGMLLLQAEFGNVHCELMTVGQQGSEVVSAERRCQES